MIILLAICTGIYVLLILSLVFGWTRVPIFRLKHLAPQVKFSIIIPYRNEAENLDLLLLSIQQIDYPNTHFEVLLVNDASKDNSQTICANFKKQHPNLPLSLLENLPISKSPKKDAIRLAVNSARFDHIITSDADCELPVNFLKAYNEHILHTGAQLIAGPVMLSSYASPAKSLRQERGLYYFRAFQEMDFLSLQAAGAGGFGLGKAFICNGANLCYRKDAFDRVDGFIGNQNISSGDDVFLLQKFIKNGLKVSYLKCHDAIVTTRPQPNLPALISQRIRWAAKTPAYTSWFAKAIGLTVLLMNFLLLLSFALAILDLIPYRHLMLFFLFKFIVDLLLIYAATKFFDRREILRNYFWSSLMYPLFSTTVAIMSLFRKFEWKGRSYKK